MLGAVNLARLLLPSMLERHGGTFSLVTRAEAVLVSLAGVRECTGSNPHVVSVNKGVYWWPQGAPYCGALAGSQRALDGYFTALHHEHCGAGIR